MGLKIGPICRVPLLNEINDGPKNRADLLCLLLLDVINVGPRNGANYLYVQKKDGPKK
jgi:hypothetical protein